MKTILILCAIALPGGSAYQPPQPVYQPVKPQAAKKCEWVTTKRLNASPVCVYPHSVR